MVFKVPVAVFHLCVIVMVCDRNERDVGKRTSKHDQIHREIVAVLNIIVWRVVNKR